MIKKLSLLVIALSISSAVFSTAGQDKAKPTARTARKIPGITTQDAFPRGCVDCHTNHYEMNLDARLISAMQRWNSKVEPALLAKAQGASANDAPLKGKHPLVPFALKNIPAACITCHSEKSILAPPFAQMMHSIHLTGGSENQFLKVYQGECTHCHKLNVSTGLWTLPTAPEP
jgi:hypothetical protein